MKLTTTPWGTPDEQKEIAEGIIMVTTPSHGGIWISQERRDRMEFGSWPTFAGGNWYEEDCDFALVVLSWPEYFSPELVEGASRALAWMKERNIINERKAATA